METIHGITNQLQAYGPANNITEMIAMKYIEEPLHNLSQLDHAEVHQELDRFFTKEQLIEMILYMPTEEYISEVLKTGNNKQYQAARQLQELHKLKESSKTHGWQHTVKLQCFNTTIQLPLTDQLLDAITMYMMKLIDSLEY
jgi:hypothetical protein